MKCELSAGGRFGSESEWRFTVADAGMSLSEWTLAARYVGFPDVYFVQRVYLGSRQVSIWQSTLPGDLPHQETVWVPQVGGFPCGEDVEPD